eukprot:COSAG02_NODE_343_length_24147_cov_30.662051_8_plen_209_part_00
MRKSAIRLQKSPLPLGYTFATNADPQLIHRWKGVARKDHSVAQASFNRSINCDASGDSSTASAASCASNSATKATLRWRCSVSDIDLAEVVGCRSAEWYDSSLATLKDRSDLARKRSSENCRGEVPPLRGTLLALVDDNGDANSTDLAESESSGVDVAGLVAISPAAAVAAADGVLPVPKSAAFQPASSACDSVAKIYLGIQPGQATH